MDIILKMALKKTFLASMRFKSPSVAYLHLENDMNYSAVVNEVSVPQ